MDVISILALVVIVLLVVLFVIAFVELAKWPKKIATKRGNPQADAISMLSWLGLLFTGGAGWIVAMVWASAGPIRVTATPAGEEV